MKEMMAKKPFFERMRTRWYQTAKPRKNRAPQERMSVAGRGL